jgi:hypothetical protein
MRAAHAHRRRLLPRSTRTSTNAGSTRPTPAPPAHVGGSEAGGFGFGGELEPGFFGLIESGLGGAQFGAQAFELAPV